MNHADGIYYTRVQCHWDQWGGLKIWEPFQPLQATRGTSRGQAEKQEGLIHRAGLKPSIHLQCKFKGATSHMLVLINWSQEPYIWQLTFTIFAALRLPSFFSSPRALLHCWNTQGTTSARFFHCRGGSRLSLQWSCNDNSFLRHKHVFMTHTHLEPKAPFKHGHLLPPSGQPHRACQDAPASTGDRKMHPEHLADDVEASISWPPILGEVADEALAWVCAREGAWLCGQCLSDRTGRRVHGPHTAHCCSTTLSCIIPREDTACYYSLLSNKAHGEESKYLLPR